MSLSQVLFQFAHSSDTTNDWILVGSILIMSTSLYHLSIQVITKLLVVLTCLGQLIERNTKQFTRHVWVFEIFETRRLAWGSCLHSEMQRDRIFNLLICILWYICHVSHIMPRDKQMLMFYAEIVPTNLSSVRYSVTRLFCRKIKWKLSSRRFSNAII